MILRHIHTVPKIKRLDYITTSPIGSLTEITKDVVDGLERKNWSCKNYISGAPVFLLHYLNYDLINSKSFQKVKKRILIQPVDGIRVKEDVVKNINNNFHMCLTPASNGKRILEESGVKIPVVVVHNYYKKQDTQKVTNFYHRGLLEKGVFGYKTSNKFTFYHESTMTQRKNIKGLISSFLFAFSVPDLVDNVRLVIKGMPKKDFHILQEIIEKSKKEKGVLPQIDFVLGYLEKDQIKLIWHDVDAYVSFAHMEGFGLPLLRMAALSKPVLTLKSEISGYTDFLNDDNSYLVESKKIPMGKEEKLIFDFNDTTWEDLKSIESGAESFLSLYKDFLNQKLKKVENEILEKFEFNNILKKYIDVLQV